ncbi:MAG: baseplate J/gp47 family protein [Helicobacteraceae bacterium]|jgi:phage-related baseplate assembly protein|nr:baseplate J/gp47 family protein [Helicobacteraceae bacterium]
MSVANIPVPDIIDNLSYNEIKTEIKERLNIAFAPNVEFLESDDVLLIVEALAYREMLVRARINAAVKSQFLPTAAGADLDNIVAFYGVERSVGESDEQLRERAFLSLNRFTTAGSERSYIYHALSADARIKEVKATSPAPGEALITYFADFSYLDSEAEDYQEAFEAAKANVQSKIVSALSAKEMRPLTDNVIVDRAQEIVVGLSLEVELLTMSDAARVEAEIRERVAAFVPKIGEDIPISKIHSLAHREGVFRVNAVLAQSIVEPLSIARINLTSLTFKEASL